jgi:hypothetical protein
MMKATSKNLDPRAPLSRTTLQPEPYQPKRTPSVRIPPRPGNRAYLRALRAAEAAEWEAALAGRPSTTTDDQAEDRWHALLSLIAISAVGFALWTSGALARHWSEIAASVQRLVGGS